MRSPLMAFQYGSIYATAAGLTYMCIKWMNYEDRSEEIKRKQINKELDKKRRELDEKNRELDEKRRELFGREGEREGRL